METSTTQQSDTSPGQYLAIDPGAGRRDSIGVASFSETGEVRYFKQLTLDQFIEWLEEQVNVLHVVYEDYRIRADKLKAHQGSRVETLQTIGMIKSWCKRKNVPYSYQNSGILSIAEKWFQIEMPSDHNISHQFSALLHGLHYLKGRGLVKTALEEEIARRTETR